MGKTDLNTPCSPVSSRFSGGTSACRNLSYELFWMAMRLGMSATFWIFPKFLRARKLFWIVGAIEQVPLFPGRSLVTSTTSRREAGS